MAAIFELDENLKEDYTIFEAAPNVSGWLVWSNLLYLYALIAGGERCTDKKTCSGILPVITPYPLPGA